LTADILGAFREMGVRVQIVSTTPEMRQGEWAGNFDMIMSAWAADYPDADSFAHGVLHSKEGGLGYVCGSPVLDAIIEAGRLESDPAVRHAIYRQLEQIIARDALLL